MPHIIFIWVSFATFLHHLEILFLKIVFGNDALTWEHKKYHQISIEYIHFLDF